VPHAFNGGGGGGDDDDGYGMMMMLMVASMGRRGTAMMKGCCNVTGITMMTMKVTVAALMES
jgi:hypothetical protein